VRDKIEVLDFEILEDGKLVLLDGNGQPLKMQNGKWPEAVKLEFTRSDIGTACNSAGVLFKPNITAEHWQSVKRC